MEFDFIFHATSQLKQIIFFQYLIKICVPVSDFFHLTTYSNDISIL